MRFPARERGQSTVELTLVLPIVALVLLALFQAGLLLRDQLLVASAAREGAREAAVSPDQGRIRRAAARAAPGLDLVVTVDRGSRRGEAATVTVRSRPVRVPLVGAMVSGVEVESRASMRVERGS